jgi:hypothetical protein
VKAGHAEYLCGNESMSWEQFNHVLQNVKDHSLGAYFLPESCIRSLDNIMTMKLINENQHGSRACATLQKLCVRVAGFECSDPRDRVFALLGLASNVGPWEVRPDYFIEAEEVYKRLAIWNIIKQKDLSGFSYAHDRQNSLPSWILDLTRPGDQEHFCDWEQSVSFSADGRSQPIVRLSCDDSI